MSDYEELKREILSKLKQAMLAKDELTVATLRMVNSALKNYEIDLRTEDGEMDLNKAFRLLQSEIKKRKDVALQYNAAGRNELANQELAETEIIAQFLPTQLTEEELREITIKAIQELGLDSRSQTKQLLDYVESHSEQGFDRALASQIFSEQQ